METKDYLKAYYEDYDEDGRLLSRHGHVEYLTTMTYIQKYLTPGMRVLEIGAATGRYSHAIARMGYAVDAVELVEHNIEQFHRNTQPGQADGKGGTAPCFAVHPDFCPVVFHNLGHNGKAKARAFSGLLRGEEGFKNL